MYARRQLTVMAVVAAGLLYAADPVAADPGGDGGPGGAPRLSLAYEVYSGGFHVLAVDLDLAVALDHYDVVARFRTTGFMSWLLGWQQVSHSTGALAGAAVEPLHHRADGELRGQRRHVTIDYADGRVTALAVDPPPREDEDREEVSAPLRDGTLDPLSAILAMVRAVSDGRGCTGRLAVFDGRRRYDLVFTDRGIRPMPGSRYVAASAAMRECDFVYEAIAGRARHPADPTQERKLQSGRAWIAAAPTGSLAAPMRIELDGNWGMTIVHLRELHRGDRPTEPRSGSARQEVAPNNP